VLDTLGTNDVVRTDEADEATKNDDVSVDSPDDSPPVTPHPTPRSLASNASDQCALAIWFRVDCVGLRSTQVT